jgi:long-chain acyl-CoA synthetase
MMTFSLAISRVCRWVGFESRLAHTLVFDAARKRLGGALEWFVVAGEPFSRQIHEELSAILGIEIVAVYGLSEAGGAVSVTDRRDIEPGTVGSLVPGMEVKFSEAGEVLLKSPAAFTTYWQAPDIAEKAHVDGWFRTGDKGGVDAFGNLVIHGRGDDILAYQPGVELALPFLTMSYRKYVIVNDIFIAPFKEKRTFVAIVVTSERWVGFGVRREGLTPEEAEGFAQNPAIRDWIRLCLRKGAREERLPHLAYLAAIRATVTPFTADESLHTPTGKQRRSAFSEKFAQAIADMKTEVVRRRERKGLPDGAIEYDDEQDE